MHYIKNGNIARKQKRLMAIRKLQKQVYLDDNV